MEFLVATAIGLLTATGLYLALRGHSFPVILGTVLMLGLAVSLMNLVVDLLYPLLDPRIDSR